jgi:hypothetical protein
MTSYSSSVSAAVQSVLRLASTARVATPDAAARLD